MADALRYKCHIDFSNKNNAHTLLVLLAGKNKRVLEIGPASGYISLALTKRGSRVTGVEIDPDAAELAADHCERVIVGDIEKADLHAELEDEQFDVVMLGDVLEHLLDPRSALVKLRDYLAPGGHILASIPNVGHGSIRLALLAGQFPYTEIGLLDRTHLRFFTLESIRDMMQQAGYRIAKVRRVLVDPFATELHLKEASYPPDLVESLRNDVEAMTYQFVIKATVAPGDPRPQRSRPPRVRPGAALVQLGVHLSELWATVRDKEGHITNLQQMVLEKDRHITNLQAMVLENDRHITNLRAMVAERDALMGEMQRELQAFQRSPVQRALRIARRALPGRSERERPDAKG